MERRDPGEGDGAAEGVGRQIEQQRKAPGRARAGFEAMRAKKRDSPAGCEVQDAPRARSEPARDNRGQEPEPPAKARGAGGGAKGMGVSYVESSSERVKSRHSAS